MGETDDILGRLVSCVPPEERLRLVANSSAAESDYQDCHLRWRQHFASMAKNGTGFVMILRAGQSRHALGDGLGGTGVVQLALPVRAVVGDRQGTRRPASVLQTLMGAGS
ncbi:hypothetical protein ADK74_03895 [Streptomyces decoyicus]|nr:hypothetical protein ADK74_03895 [Streptomyces decoyicus]